MTADKMTDKVAELSQGFGVEGLITLFEIDLTHIGFGVLRFTPDVNKTKQPILWGGVEYIPFPVEVSGFERSTQGAQARPTLTVAAIIPEMTALLISAKGLQGATVTRTRTYMRFLDDGVDPDINQHFPKDVYRVERIAEWEMGKYAKLELACPLDMETSMFPKRQILRDHCSWIYRVWDSEKKQFVYSKISPCPYAGTKYFDKRNKPTTQEKDACSKSLDGCKARFGDNAALPFGGFPAVAPLAR